MTQRDRQEHCIVPHCIARLFTDIQFLYLPCIYHDNLSIPIEHQIRLCLLLAGLQHAYPFSHIGEQPPASEYRQHASSSKESCCVHRSRYIYKLWYSRKLKAALLHHLSLTTAIGLPLRRRTVLSHTSPTRCCSSGLNLWQHQKEILRLSFLDKAKVYTSFNPEQCQR